MHADFMKCMFAYIVLRDIFLLLKTFWYRDVLIYYLTGQMEFIDSFYKAQIGIQGQREQSFVLQFSIGSILKSTFNVHQTENWSILMRVFSAFS